MQDTSQIANYDAIIASGDYEIESQLVINGVAYGEDMLIDMFTTPSLFTDVPSVGNCYSAEIDVTMLVPNEYIPPMAELRPYVRLRSVKETQYLVYNGKLIIPNGSIDGKKLILTENSYVVGKTLYLNDSTNFESIFTVYSDWLPQGVFYIDTREQEGNEVLDPILRIHGYDSMLMAEAMYPVDEAEYPKPDTYVVDLIAETIGVEVDERTYDIMTEEYQINLPATYTMREVLGYIGSMYAGNWCITPLGKLRLVGLTDIGAETNFLIDQSGDAIVLGEDRILV